LARSEGPPSHPDVLRLPDEPTHLYCGLVGEYCGLVGEYCGLVGEYCGLVGEYWGLVGEYCGLQQAEEQVLLMADDRPRSMQALAGRITACAPKVK
jgi:hypothetical protein